jgi:cobalt/nickel transport system permease protein
VEARYLDHYSYLSSPVHRLPASLKFGVAIGAVLLVLLIPVTWWVFHLAVVCAIILVGLASRLPVAGLAKRIWWIWLVVLALAAGRLFQPDGLRLFVSTLIRASECLLIMVLLANTTRFTALLDVLSGIGLPKVLITTLGLMYRYLFVLSDERNRMQRARRSRTFTAGRWSQWRIRATILSQLFLRCTDRANRIYAAMCARGMQ